MNNVDRRTETEEAGEVDEPAQAEAKDSDACGQGAVWDWSVECIQRRANTVTTILRGILHRHTPVRYEKFWNEIEFGKRSELEAVPGGLWR